MKTSLYDIIAAFYLVNRKVGQICVASVAGSNEAEVVVEAFTKGAHSKNIDAQTVAVVECALERLYSHKIVTVYMKELVASENAYSNDVLTTIMGKLETIIPDFKDNVKVMEDYPTKWAITINDLYYFTAHKAIKEICTKMGAAFRASTTNDPAWDVFYSA